MYVCMYVNKMFCSPFSVASTSYSKTTSPVKESHGRGNFNSAVNNAMSPTRKKNMGMYICMYAYFFYVFTMCVYEFYLLCTVYADICVYTLLYVCMYGVGFSFSPSKSGRQSNVPILSESSDDYGDIHNEEDFLDPTTTTTISAKSPDLDHNRHTYIQAKATLNKAILSATNSKAATRNKATKSNAVGSGLFTHVCMYATTNKILVYVCMYV